MPLYLDCYTYPQDLLRAAGDQLSVHDYNTLWQELEEYELTKDEIAEELSERHSIDIELHYPN